MSKLARVEDTRNRAGLPDSDAVNSLIGQMLDAATIHVEAMLRTSFARQVTTDKYNINREDDRYRYAVKLYLTNGYVDPDDVGQVIEVRSSSEFHNLATADVLTLDEIYTLDSTKGLVQFLKPAGDSYPLIHAKRSLFAKYIQIAYTSGFTTGTDGFGKFYKNVPPYLGEVATQLAIKMFFEAGGCGIKDPVKDRAKLFSLDNLLQPYIRWYPSAVKPLV